MHIKHNLNILYIFMGGRENDFPMMRIYNPTIGI